DTETELKLLQAIELLDKRHPITLIPTFLPAHAVPPEYEGRADEYIQLIIDDMLPQAWAWYQQSHFAAQNIPFFIDVFCEEGVFTLEQSHRVLDAGKRLGMQVKAHVDEFVHLGGVPMALSLGAVSVDHLDATPPEDITTLAQSN
ncbi:MAG: imidazolonepropionase, partial [Phototrophicales bacterium]